MVEFVDGSILSQLSTPDMCLPIQYALTWPSRATSDRVQTDFAALGRLDFEAPDLAKFPALGQARRAGETGGTLPAVLNAANEIAVDAFCDRQMSFPGISDVVGQVMDRHQVVEHPTLDEIIEADQWARETAREVVGLGQAIA
jgi:1-deoxy-D-xylulose-5-phosphate reductoisomerase